jgi:hypothetical protein
MGVSLENVKKKLGQPASQDAAQARTNNLEPPTSPGNPGVPNRRRVPCVSDERKCATRSSRAVDCGSLGEEHCRTKPHIAAAIPQPSKHKHKHKQHTAWRLCGHQSSAAASISASGMAWHGMAWQGNESIKQQAAAAAATGGDVRQGSQREKLR